ncbi:hypothetical protein RI054_14g68700 [Pseudoscourfieldia marina]
MAPWLRSHTSMTRQVQKRPSEPCTAASASVSSASSVSSALWDVIITHGFSPAIARITPPPRKKYPRSVSEWTESSSSQHLPLRTLAKLACVSREASIAVRAIFKTTKTIKIQRIFLKGSSAGIVYQDERISALARNLTDTDAFANVMEVDISDRVCTEVGLSALLQAIESGALKHLTHLNLGINPISTDGIRELIRVAEGGALAQLSVLKLDYIDMDDEGVRLLGQAGERGAFGQVTELSLESNEEFGVDGVRALAQSIQRGAFAQLTSLNLSGTKVCAIGFRELAEAAEHNLAQLKVLNLRGCGIYESQWPDDGSDPDTDELNFFNAMQAMKRGAFAGLTSLMIDSNDVDSTGVQMLVDAIEEGALSKLTELHVSYTSNDNLIDNSNQIWLAVAGALERGRLPHLEKFSGGWWCESEILSDCTDMLARDIASLIGKHGTWSTGDESTDKELVTRVHRAHELQLRLSDARRQRLSDLTREGREMDAAIRRLSLRRSVRETLQPYVSPTDSLWWERKYVPLQTKFFNALLSIRSLIYSYRTCNNL